jgi:Tub family
MRHCHCVLSKSAGSSSTITMRDEFTREVICRATSDESFRSGFWFLTDGEESEKVVATVEGGFTGLSYSLLSVRRETLAVVSVSAQMSPKPVSLTLTLGPEQAASGFHELLSSVGVSCASYVALEEQPFPHNYNLAAIDLQSPPSFISRAPLWNNETHSFLHNLGSRVKKSNNRNCILISALTPELSKEEAVQTVHLRFGQLNSQREYVLDYRPSSFDALTAMAVVCAALTEKTLCPL